MNVTLTNAELSVEIAELGAELQRIQDRQGRDWLWNGDPAYWKGRAPLLPFAVVLPTAAVAWEPSSVPLSKVPSAGRPRRQ